MTKEDYKANREAGRRGQGEYPSVLVGYTPADDVIQGAYRIRKARRAVQVHRDALKRRRQRAVR